MIRDEMPNEPREPFEGRTVDEPDVTLGESCRVQVARVAYELDRLRTPLYPSGNPRLKSWEDLTAPQRWRWIRLTTPPR